MFLYVSICFYDFCVVFGVTPTDVPTKPSTQAIPSRTFCRICAQTSTVSQYTKKNQWIPTACGLRHVRHVTKNLGEADSADGTLSMNLGPTRFRARLHKKKLPRMPDSR